MDKPIDSNSPLYVNIRFRFHIRSNSVDSETLNYLKSCSRETNNMMLEAIRPYWMAVACRDSGFVEREELQKLSVQSVSALCSRARYLCATFGLDPAAFGLSPVGVVSLTPILSIPKAVPLAEVEESSSNCSQEQYPKSESSESPTSVEGTVGGTVFYFGTSKKR